MASATAEHSTSGIPRLKAIYRKDIVPALTEQFSFTNPHQVPSVIKVWSTQGWVKRLVIQKSSRAPFAT